MSDLVSFWFTNLSDFFVVTSKLSLISAWQGPWRGKDDRQGGQGQGTNQGGMFGRNNRETGKFASGNRESNKFGNDRQNGIVEKSRRSFCTNS